LAIAERGKGGRIMAQGKFGTKPGRGGTTSNPMVLVMGFFFMLFSVLGGSLFYLSISQKVAPKPTDVSSIVKVVDVIVPLRDMKAGSELDPAFFGVESRPETSVSSKTLRNIENIKGKYAAFDIISGQPLLVDFVTDRRPSTVIQNRIPEGFRMVTIRVDATSSVEGWARPGARVDVTWIGAQSGEPVAKVVVEAAEILSYNGGAGSAEGSSNQEEGVGAPSTVSLLVTKDDSLKIQLSQTTGRLSLSLRTDKDLDTTAEKPSIGMGDVIRSTEDKGRCREARKRGIIDQTKANGDIEKMVLDDLGSLVPLSQYCSAESEK
jgi:Flp pilus assembly protein CpaB